MKARPKALLALEDGTVFQGRSIGASGSTSGEIVFNTSHCGYQEILTDPSYCRQIVVMSFPLIGNYSFEVEDQESERIQVAGFAVTESAGITSSSGSSLNLHEYLERNGVVGIENIDTRAVVRHVRSKGAMRAVISALYEEQKSLIERAKSIPPMKGSNLVDEVCSYPSREYLQVNAGGRIPIALMDFGAKQSIINSLIQRDCKVMIFSARTSAEEILKSKPAGIILSNGPGDPAALNEIISEIKKFIGKLPIFGICLGHQLLALAANANTYKLPFGHRGGNHPVIDLKTNSISITSQNHGFAVDEESLPKNVEATERNLYDGTNEGISLTNTPAFSVQYHPEARPGPRESAKQFDKFLKMVKEFNHA
ncbi:MAG: carbamoyl phosphate synthase small subunit [Candidatus Hydrogenedentes bacterium CG07_land_8_20_14_0_80_42_17]|nr:MAG: carbamoyl phosphate synthase small subunit [Candidatus Hydrogenedentes bacterium CG1_02_42_14]PIU48115.1 MAG: carbamoyl phosphate synthase small subunit [Candidatus Hydrogenedentes bacterium CG07_land_8_20_14_0_80_42_17]